MILARVVQHLKGQQWTAVFLDFLIVVLGVFVANQVTNWNDARIEHERAHGYLVRLHDDLMQDVGMMNANLAFTVQVSTYADRALAYAEHRASAKGAAWPTVLAFYQAGQIYPNVTDDTTYREMTSAGDLRLLQSQRLSAAIGAYYSGRAQSARTLFDHLPAYRETIRELMPFSVQAYIWDHCYRQTNTTDQRMVDCASPITDAQAREILRGLLADPKAVRQLRLWATEARIENTVQTVERAAAVRLAHDVANASR